MRALPILLMLALGSAAPAAAQDAGRGAELYRLYCAGCHGATARGNGPMADLMNVPPADLTSLAAGNEGVFPTFRVVSQIDGRDPLRAHGGEMPVFGDAFEGGRDVALRTDAGQPILTSPPIADLVAWLRGIQR